MKVINVKGIIILFSVLLVFHVAVGLIISPFASSYILEMIEEKSDVKITVDSINVWPLTLSCSLKGLKVFDPDSDTEIIADIKKASARLSLMGLLSKRIVISSVNVSGALINLKREPDGSFNVQKIAGGDDARPTSRLGSLFDRFKGKKDWIGRIFEAIKNRYSKKKDADQQKEARKIITEVEELPSGRRVNFKIEGADYIFEIKKLVIKNARIHMDAGNGEGVDIENAGLKMKGIAVDPKKGVRIEMLEVNGSLNKEGEPAGKFKISYEQKVSRGGSTTDISIVSEDVDMAAINFIYSDSLKVSMDRGRLDLKSKTSIVDGKINSENKLILSGHHLVPKRGFGRISIGMVSTPIICEALNKIDPIKMEFDITGSVDKPELKGFTDTLLNIAKPSLQGAAEGGSGAIEAIKSLFKSGS